MAWIPTNLIVACPFRGFPTEFGTTSALLDNVGESVGYIGDIILSSGPGSSAVLDTTSGCFICWTCSSTTVFSNAGTNLRVGVQDLGATGIETGTFDVYGDNNGVLVNVGTNIITQVPMIVGSKTITYGQPIAVVIEMTSRGGTDAIRPMMMGGANSPYCSWDVGAGPVKTSNYPNCTIHFANGVIGYFNNAAYVPAVGLTNTAFGSGSSPNEYGIAFRLPFPARYSQIIATIGDCDVGDVGTFFLYSEPFATIPRTVQTFTTPIVRTTITAATAEAVVFGFSGYLDANRWYALTFKVTSAATMTLVRRAALDSWRALNWHEFVGVSRTTSGAFAQTPTNTPSVGLRLSEMDVTQPLPRTRPLKVY